ncbi:helix-turn-helix domain-containing protein [Chryseobacterium gambrini]|uniref:AraC family transcriptional regulator n=1 Tax=Chryseobacterium gambrini TaxID=373672 RepID=A0ABM8K8T8_9FLAO|nr:AraC family transcriptional regulator [Chryseobacterium gambrini]
MILYRRIIDYTEKNKFYLNSNASIYDLTQSLNTNRTYISAALNQKGKTNFNDFINSYRINFVIQEFQQDIHKKYTLKVIYTSAGFVHQSQFNRAFKKIMGKSPREYLKDINS